MCSFQRCGNIERQTVAYYKTLDELYTAEQVDNVILARIGTILQSLTV